MNPAIDKVLSDPVEFISRLRIKDKKGKYKTFGNVLTDEQIQIIKAITDPEIDRIAIVKARQLGITTACRAALFWETYTSNRSINSALCSNKLGSATELLKIDKRFLNNLPKPLRRTCSERVDRMVFPSTDSTILAVSAQGDGHNRGFTFNHAHASEFAFYDHPEEFLASLIASTNDGKIILESTANHYGDALHNIARTNHYDERWKVIFLPWTSFPQYSLKLPKGGIEWDAGELKLMEDFSLTPEQVYWRRRKIGEIKDERLFRREFPLTIEEAYSLSEENYFAEEHFQHLDIVEIGNSPIQVITERETSDIYVCGVDLAAGVGGDYSVATVVSKLTSAPVAVLSSNKMSIHDFTIATMNLAKRFNAQIVFENNHGGGQFQEILNNNSWRNYKSFTTTAKSKMMLYDCLRTYLEENLIAYLDQPTYAEMRNLVKDPKGLAPKHPPGSHDDRVISYALALYHLQGVSTPRTDYDKWMEQVKREQRSTKQINPLMRNHPLKRRR
jgi:hypothetical protein